MYQYTVWKYTRNVKHLFYTADDAIPVCGLGMLYTMPLVWKDDETGLGRRSQCGSCTRVERCHYAVSL